MFLCVDRCTSATISLCPSSWTDPRYQVLGLFRLLVSPIIVGSSHSSLPPLLFSRHFWRRRWPVAAAGRWGCVRKVRELAMAPLRELPKLDLFGDPWLGEREMRESLARTKIGWDRGNLTGDLRKQKVEYPKKKRHKKATIKESWAVLLRSLSLSSSFLPWPLLFSLLFLPTYLPPFSFSSNLVAKPFSFSFSISPFFF